MEYTQASAKLRRWLLLSLLLRAISLPARQLAGQESPTLTPTVFQRYADRVVKIQLVESGSVAKSSVGSGFFVSDSGLIVTNYHVIAAVVHTPEHHRLELVHGTRTLQQVTILAIDVVNDLAILQSELRPERHFTLTAGSAPQGVRLYALGHPHDLGLSIVEGTYNGPLEHTLYPKLHFTGSLNPGMSGGPTISAAGRVIGVNVATSGNEVSFLVPVEHAAALAARVLTPGYRPPTSFLAEVGREIRQYQDVYLKNMFEGEIKTIELGRYHVVTEPAAFFRCWGDAVRSKELLYERADHSCSTDDYVFIASDQESGVINLSHELITTTALGAVRFYALYSGRFQRDNTPGGEAEHVTSWRCGTRNVRNASTPLRAVLCLRRYRKLGELYDAVLKVAVLGQRDSGLISTLTLTGVSFENISRLSRRYLELVTLR